MLLNILALLLILAIVFWQALQGMFSSLIMALVTLVCMLLAFNFYEPLAAKLLYDRQPAYGDATMLIALLFGLLLLARILLDRFLGVNVVPPALIDRAGGAIFGLFTALWLVGTLTVAVQMLPFYRTIGNYDAFDDNLTTNSMWIPAPRFTLGTVQFLSSGSMSSRQPFEAAHDDLLLELWGARNRDARANAAAKPGDLTVTKAFDMTDEPYPDTSGLSYPLVPETTPTRVYALHVEVDKNAADENGKWQIKGTQFRLVTRDGASFYPVGYLTSSPDWQVNTADMGKLDMKSDDDDLRVDLLYRVPSEKELSYMAFRRVATSSVPTPVPGLPSEKSAMGGERTSGEITLNSPRATRSMFFIPDKIIAGQEMPTKLRFRVGGDTYTFPSGATVTTTNRNYARGTVEGALSQIGPAQRGVAGTRIVSNFASISGKKVVLVTGRANARGAGVGDSSLQPQVVFSDGGASDAVGGWVMWSDAGGTLYMTFEPDGSGARPDPRLLQLYRDHVGQVQQVGFIFLVPGNSVISGFRFGTNAAEIQGDALLNVDGRD